MSSQPRNRHVDASSLDGERSISSFDRSRPSKTNCTTTDGDVLPSEEGTWRGYWWRKKNAVIDQFLEERSSRAMRPVSVRDTQKLREECTQKSAGSDGLRARSWSGVLRKFLTWYNDYRHAHLRFRSPDGDLVRAPMPNSHQPGYGNKYYARIKALERQMVKQYDDLHIALLTFSGSSTNENGGWRCPVDHLRDVVDSWRPDRGRGVYHALRDSLDGREWEYATVCEKHKSGYGHVHVAVFVDGEISEEDFHPAIDAHLRQCDIAHRDAHDYYATDPDVRPISISKVNQDLDQNADDVDTEQVIGNLGSYVAEYIGAHGEELLDRNIDELQFRAAAWASGTQMVRFSTGANEMIADDLGRDRDDDDPALDFPTTTKNPSFDPEKHAHPDSDVKPFEPGQGEWSIDGVARVDEGGESVYQMQRKGVEYAKIEDHSQLDPPKQLPPDRPQRRTSDTTLSEF